MEDGQAAAHKFGPNRGADGPAERPAAHGLPIACGMGAGRVNGMSGPNRAHELRSVADKPNVFMLLRGSRLAACIGNQRRDHFAGSIGDNRPQHVVKLSHGVALQNMGFNGRGNVFDDVALGVVQPGPGRRFRVVAAGGNVE